VDPDPYQIFYISLAILTLASFHFCLRQLRMQMDLINRNYSNNESPNKHITYLYNASIQGSIREVTLLLSAFITVITILVWLHFFHLIMTSFWSQIVLTTFASCVWIYIFGYFIPEITVGKTPYSGLIRNRIIITLVKPFAFLFTPIVNIRNRWMNDVDSQLPFSFLTLEHLQRMQGDGVKNDGSNNPLDDNEQKMIRNIMDFDETPVNEVMTPRPEMIALEVDTSLKEVLEMVQEEKLSRIPVCKKNLDQIVGVLHTKDLLFWSQSNTKEFHLKDIVRPTLSTHSETPISDLLTELKQTRNHIAVVCDDYGGTLGLVTMEDLLEEIVGEIYDEDDEVEVEIKEVRPGHFLIAANLPLDEIQEATQVRFDLNENINVDTLAGFLQHKLGRVPRKGNVWQNENCKIKVLQMQGSRLITVLMENTQMSQSMGEKTN
jgi:putative hemolysin